MRMTTAPIRLEALVSISVFIVLYSDSVILEVM